MAGPRIGVIQDRVGDHQPHHQRRDQRKPKGGSQMDQEGMKGHFARRYRPAQRRAQPDSDLAPLQNFRIDHHGRVGRAIQSRQDIPRRRFRHARRAFFRAGCRMRADDDIGHAE